MIEKFNVRDHVWGLVHLRRFCGKGDRQVSVAHHLLHCHEIARIWQPDNTNLKLYSLLHDMPEAYYQDDPGFMKPLYGPEYKDVQDRVDEIIFTQVGLTQHDRIVVADDVKRVDSNALTIEASYAFDKWEPYHWPPMDLYDKTDILEEFINLDDKSTYHEYMQLLETYGETNEVLRNTLYSA